MHYQRRLIYGVCLPLLSDNQTDTALVIHPAFPLACASGLPFAEHYGISAK